MSSRTAWRLKRRYALTTLALAAWQLTQVAVADTVPVGATRLLVPGEVVILTVKGTVYNEVMLTGAGAISVAALEIDGPNASGQGMVVNRLGAYMPVQANGIFINWGGKFYNQTGAALIFAGSSDFTLSAMENDKGASFFNQSGALITAVATMNNLGGSSFINESTNSRIFLNSALATNGQIVNKGTGTLFDNRDSAAIQLSDNSSIINQAGATFRNRNLATIAAINTSQLINTSAFENSGQAQLLLSGANFTNASGGSFQNLSGASIGISSLGNFINDGSATSLLNSGGASITVGNGSSLQNLNSAQLTHTGAGSRITIDGGYAKNSGSAKLSNLAGAVVDVKNGIVVNEFGATWLNDGTATHLDIGYQGTYTNRSSFTNQNAAFVGIGGAFQNQAGASIYNQTGGTLAVSVATGAPLGWTFLNSQGVIVNQDAGSSLSVGANTRLTSSGTGAQVFNQKGAQLSVSGGGAVFENLNASQLQNVSAGSVLAVSLGGTLINANGALLNNVGGAQLSVFSGTLNNSFSSLLVNAGVGAKLSLSFGVLNNSAGVVNNNSALLDIGTGSTFTNSGAGTLSNEVGATVKLSGSMVNDATVTNKANFTMLSGSQVSGGGIYVQNDVAAVTDVNGSWTQGSTQVLAGTFRGTGTIGGAVLNAGTITAQGTGLTFSGAVSGTGSFLGTTRFNGSLDPGGANGGLGLMNVSTAVLGATNRLNIEIGGLVKGTGYDALLGGSIALGGTLAVSLVPTFNTGANPLLKLGDSFDVLSGSALTGDFSSFELPGLAAGLGWAHQTLTTNVFGVQQTYRLTVTVVPEPGTWALMLGGLLATGSVVRRRQASL